MNKEKKLEYIVSLKGKAAGINDFEMSKIEHLIDEAKFIISRIHGKDSPYLNDVDVFKNNKTPGVVYDWFEQINTALNKLRFEVENEEDDSVAELTNYKNKNHTGKIFISHSTKDYSLVRKFVDQILILGLSMEKEKIFCISTDGLGIKSGEDFKKAVYEQLLNAKAVIQIITKNYKASEVCLNEMGAAWMTNATVIPLVMSPDNYDVGFIHANTQQLKLNEQKDLVKLYDDHKEIILLTPPSIHHTVWNHSKETFSFFLRIYKSTHNVA